jgi:hypothetical protein
MQRRATTVGHMGNPEDELIDLLGDKPDGVVQISEQVLGGTSHDRSSADESRPTSRSPIRYLQRARASTGAALEA